MLSRDRLGRINPENTWSYTYLEYFFPHLSSPYRKQKRRQQSHFVLPLLLNLRLLIYESIFGIANSRQRFYKVIYRHVNTTDLLVSLQNKAFSPTVKLTLSLYLSLTGDVIKLIVYEVMLQITGKLRPLVS